MFGWVDPAKALQQKMEADKNHIDTERKNKFDRENPKLDNMSDKRMFT